MTAAYTRQSACGPHVVLLATTAASVSSKYLMATMLQKDWCCPWGSGQKTTDLVHGSLCVILDMFGPCVHLANCAKRCTAHLNVDQQVH